jgi:multiple antibiotic resistance protein
MMNTDIRYASSMVPDIASFALLSLTSVLIIVNPIGAMLVYVTLTDGLEAALKKAVAKESCTVAFAILLIFSIAGTWILQIFGITLDAFRIGGGILLFGIGMEMVYAKVSRTKLTATEKYESIDAEGISVMPLATPIIAGPGSITTVVVLANEAISIHVLSVLVVIGAAAITIGLTYLILSNADRLTSHIGEREYRVTNRLMGILLIAIAVQFVITGIQGAFPALMG